MNYFVDQSVLFWDQNRFQCTTSIPKIVKLNRQIDFLEVLLKVDLYSCLPNVKNQGFRVDLKWVRGSKPLYKDINH